MTDRATWFNKLMHDPPEHREKFFVTRFLEETAEAVNARYKGTALRTAADFDRFKKQADQEYDNSAYAKFFTTLSAIIKEFHLEHWNNDKTQPADTIDEPEELDIDPKSEIIDKALQNR